MEKDMIKERIEQWKLVAEDFLRDDIRVFVKDINNNLYFADLLFVGEHKVRLQCFAPEQRKNLKFTLYWTEIKDFDKFRKEVRK